MLKERASNQFAEKTFINKVRTGLAEENVSLAGRSGLKDHHLTEIDNYCDSVEVFLNSFQNVSNKEQKVVDKFCIFFRKNLEKVYKAAKRLKMPFGAHEVEMESILHAFQDDVGIAVEYMGGEKVSVSKISDAFRVSVYTALGELMYDVLSTNSIVSYLSETGYETDEEEVESIFMRGVRLHFAVHNIGKPLEAVARVYEHLEETLSTNSIVNYLKVNGYETDEEEVESIFTRSIRLRFAVANIGNPLEAVARVYEHLEDTLSTKSIVSYLVEKGYKANEEEVESIFNRRIRLYFAVKNIGKPLEVVARVYEHLDDTLSTKSIVSYLREKDYETDEEEVESIFTRSLRLRFAVNNIGNPLEALARVYEHLEDTLSTKSILSYLREKGYETNEEEVESIFTRSVRLRFAVNNIGKPLEALARVYDHLEDTLSTKSLVSYLREKGYETNEEEDERIFTRGLRLHFAVGNIGNPLEAVARFYEHLEDTLSDENIVIYLSEQGYEVSELEVERIFTRSIKLRFAVRNISDPLSGILKAIEGKLIDERGLEGSLEKYISYEEIFEGIGDFFDF